MKNILFESFEEHQLFLHYVKEIFKLYNKSYFLLTNNFFCKLFASKAKLNDYESIINLTDKLITVLKNKDSIIFKTNEDLLVLLHITDTNNILNKLVLVSYSKEYKDKLYYLLNRIHLQLTTN